MHGGVNQELAIFSQLVNEPIFTSNISKTHLACQPAPGAGSQGEQRQAGRVAGGGSTKRLPFQHLSVVHQRGGEKTPFPKPTEGAEACRAAEDP